jgi:hypothetical protein
MMAKFNEQWLKWEDMTEAQQDEAMERWFATLPTLRAMEKRCRYEQSKKMIRDLAEFEARERLAANNEQ